MIAIAVAATALTVIGVGRTVVLVAKDGHGRVPTRTSTHVFDLR